MKLIRQTKQNGNRQISVLFRQIKVNIINQKEKEREKRQIRMLSLRVELKTSRLLNGCSNQLSYESFLLNLFGTSTSTKTT